MGRRIKVEFKKLLLSAETPSDVGIEHHHEYSTWWKRLEAFHNDELMEELVFSHLLSKDQRDIINYIAAKLELQHLFDKKGETLRVSKVRHVELSPPVTPILFPVGVGNQEPLVTNGHNRNRRNSEGMLQLPAYGRRSSLRYYFIIIVVN